MMVVADTVAGEEINIRRRRARTNDNRDRKRIEGKEEYKKEVWQRRRKE